MTKADEMRNAVLLAFVFVCVIFANFGVVALISLEYETDGTSEDILLWVSDTDTNFPTYDLGTTGIPDWLERGTVQQFRTTTAPTEYTQNNYTPAYLGNNTWGTTIENVPTDTYVTNAFSTYMALPNLKNWVMSKVIINVTLPSEDCKLFLNVYHHQDPFKFSTPSSTGLHSSQWTTLKITDFVTESEYDVSYPVTLPESLRIYDHSQQEPFTDITLTWQDLNFDGMSSFSPTWTIQIWGKQISGWGITDSLLVYAIGFSILNTTVIIFMFDRVDLLGYKKSTLGQKSKPRKKKSKSKRKNR